MNDFRSVTERPFSLLGIVLYLLFTPLLSFIPRLGYPITLSRWLEHISFCLASTYARATLVFFLPALSVESAAEIPLLERGDPMPKNDHRMSCLSPY